MNRTTAHAPTRHAQPNHLVPLGMKNPADCRAAPYAANQATAKYGAEPVPPRKMACNPAANPTKNGGSKANATRRVGSDQNGSRSLIACLRTKSNTAPTVTNATANQNKLNARSLSSFI